MKHFRRVVTGAHLADSSRTSARDESAEHAPEAERVPRHLALDPSSPREVPLALVRNFARVSNTHPLHPRRPGPGGGDAA